MTTVKLEITGNGGEFQHHYLSKKELKEILSTYKKKGTDEVVDQFLSGGRMFDETNYGGAYGCGIDSVLKIDGKKIKPVNLVLEKLVDDLKPKTSGGNLYYLATGNVTGEAEFEISGKFDPKKLEILYVEYAILEGWKSGKIISQIKYMGEEIFIDFSDDGQTQEHIACTYTTDSKGNYKDTDIFLMFDAEEEEWKFDEEIISKAIKNWFMNEIPFFEGEEFWASSAIDESENFNRNCASILTKIVEMNRPQSMLAKLLLDAHAKDKEFFIRNLNEVQNLLLQIDHEYSDSEINLFQKELFTFRKKFKLGG